MSYIISARQPRALMLAISTMLVAVMLMATSIIPVKAAQTDVRSFFRSITGEWIGTCTQSTDGSKGDNKYFHAVIKQVDSNSFAGNFDYYRIDPKTNTPLHIGTSTVTTTIAPDGTAKNHITGKGTMLVDFKPKEQSHDFQEVITATSSGLQGEGKGSISVSGVTLGLGKNGKIQNAKSNWSLSNGVLTINQSINAGFKALFFKKSFNVVASYTAKHGSDVASLMSGVRVSAKPSRASGRAL